MPWNNKYLLLAIICLVSPFLNAQQLKVFNGVGDDLEFNIPPAAIDSNSYAPFIVREIFITGNKNCICKHFIQPTMFAS